MYTQTRNAPPRGAGFDAVLQFRDRISSYIANGHPIDKIEILVLGGTWSEYPEGYQVMLYCTVNFTSATHVYDVLRKVFTFSGVFLSPMCSPPEGPPAFRPRLRPPAKLGTCIDV